MKLQLFALTLLSFAVCVASTEGFALFQEDGAEQGTAASEEASRSLPNDVSNSMSMSMSI
jgi:hypothetical protein